MLQAAANISQNPGDALLPVIATSPVAAKGVNVPNSPAARANASEKQVVRTWAGTTSTSAPSIVPLYTPKYSENIIPTITSLPKVGSAVSHTKAGYAVTKESAVIASSTGLRPMRSDRAPPIGFQMKLVTATIMVTCRASVFGSSSTFSTNDGV